MSSCNAVFATAVKRWRSQARTSASKAESPIRRPVVAGIPQDAHVGEVVDGDGVLRDVVAGAGGDMACRVEGVLGTELEAVLDDPQILGVRGQLLQASPLVRAEHLNRLVERQKNAAARPPRRAARGSSQRPNVPSARRRARASSTLRR